jgi:hypothetical protein
MNTNTFLFAPANYILAFWSLLLWTLLDHKVACVSLAHLEAILTGSYRWKGTSVGVKLAFNTSTPLEVNCSAGEVSYRKHFLAQKNVGLKMFLGQQKISIRNSKWSCRHGTLFLHTFNFLHKGLKLCPGHFLFSSLYS